MIDADDMIRCPDCGYTASVDSFNFIEREDQSRKVSETELVETIDRILWAHNRREGLDDLEDLFRKLEADSELSRLIGEALDDARRGDWRAAEHTLRRCAQPKWSSIRECEQHYASAMAEKRARKAA